MEADFNLLRQAFKGLEKHLILKESYFTKLNECYESIIFKPLPSNKPTSYNHLEQPAKALKEDSKLDMRVEEVLELANSVVSGKRAKSTPKPKPRVSAPKPKTRKSQSPAVIENRAFVLNSTYLEQLIQFKTTARANLKGTKAQAEVLKTSSEVAKANFIMTLQRKSKRANDLTPLDRKVAEICAGFSLMKEIKQILEDDDIVQSFRQIADKRGDHEQLSSVCKAKFILNWIRSGVEKLEAALEVCPEVNTIAANAAHELRRRLEDAENLTSDKFSSERKLHSSILRGNYEEVDKLKALDEWRSDAEIQKFIKRKAFLIKSLEGLRTLHCLAVKRGRGLCTITRQNAG